MKNGYELSASQLWRDFVTCAGFFLSCWGLVQSAINFYNCFNPGALSDLPSKPSKQK